MRLPSPYDGAAILDFISEPLYSAIEYDNTTFEPSLDAFNYTLTDAISGGTVAATLRETNMQDRNRLPRPRVYRVQGISVTFSPIDEDGDTLLDAVTAAATNLDMYDAVKAIKYGSRLKFSIGDKTYAEHPIFFFPSNSGLRLGGDFDYAVSDTDESARLVAPTMAGFPWVFAGESRIFLPPLQRFEVSVQSRVTLVALIDDNIMAWIAFTGEYGRETL